MQVATILLLGVLSLALGASAAQYYISPYGNDSNNGTSAQSPLLTLSKALDISSAGDTINAADGSYSGSENTGLSVSDRVITGASTSGTVFQAESGNLFSTSGTVTLENLTMKGGNFGVDMSSGSVVVADVNFSALTTAVELSYNTENMTMTRCSADGSVKNAVKYTGSHRYSWEVFSIDQCAFSTSIVQGGELTEARNPVYISATTSVPTPSFSLFSITNSTFTGKGIFISWDYGADSAVISDSVFTNCTAGTSGGGGMFIWAYTAFAVTGCTFIDNVSDSSFGGAIYFWDDTTTGGSSLLVDDCFFQGNTGIGGGALMASGTNLTLSRSVFVDNAATGYSGGAVTVASYYSPVATADINNCTFVANTAANNAGAVGFIDIPVPTVISHSFFLFNSCNQSGGGLALDHAAVSLSEVTFIGNHAGSNGGGVSVGDYAAATSNATSFILNSATSGGGAVYMNQGTSFTASASFMANNTAPDGNGGGVSMSSGTLSVHEAAFLYNGAVNGGGFSVTGSGAVEVSTVVVKGNSATKSGGGFYCSNGSVHADNTNILDNTAPQGSAYTCANSCSTSLTASYVAEDNSAYGCGTDVSGTHMEAVEAAVAAVLSQVPKMSLEDAMQQRARYGL